MKIALCFIINYDHVLNKEDIWRKWISFNQNLINVYFYYSDKKKIKSSWILKHIIPEEFIRPTSYFHVIPAYFSLFQYAIKHDPENKWFCLLTDSCCPIISPNKFKTLFLENHQKSIIKWRPAWWNIHLTRRANLSLLPSELHLANDPWFVMRREDVQYIICYFQRKPDAVKLICDGGVANESLFAIILHTYNRLSSDFVENSITHATDWSRMASSTSPYLFKEATEKNIEFIEGSLKKNPFVMFIRKVAPEFPDEVIYKYLNFEEEEKKETRWNDLFSGLIFNLTVLFLMFSYYYFYFKSI
jgi:hypothetical protein